MCLAIPGKVRELHGQKVLIDYPNESRQALAGGVELKTGDYVMVQMGVVIKVVSKEEAYSSWKAWGIK